MTITDPFGCDYSDQLRVELVEDEEPGGEDNEDDDYDDEECTVSIPNAISPNGDGINDNLEVFSTTPGRGTICPIQVTHIRIFGKWGGELYHVQGSEVEAQIWEDLPPGMVMVQVTYETVTGVVKTVGQGVMVVK